MGEKRESIIEMPGEIWVSERGEVGDGIVGQGRVVAGVLG